MLRKRTREVAISETVAGAPSGGRFSRWLLCLAVGLAIAAVILLAVGPLIVSTTFDGSTLAACVHYFDRLVTPVRPRSLVLYAGDGAAWGCCGCGEG